MYKLFIITLISLVFFLAEFILFNIFGGWVKPNLLLLLVVFFNFAFGVRYSLATGFVAGVIKDSFGIYPFGAAMVSFLFCAYMTTFIKRYLNYMGSKSSQILIVFLICLINIFVYYLIVSIFGEIVFREMIFHVAFPEIISTIFVTSFVFRLLKKCMRRFYVI